MPATQAIGRGGKPGEVIVVRLAYGDLLLESLREICRREGIRNGIILTGFGSLTDVCVTGVVGPAFPPRRFYRRRAPRGVEITGMAGVIADYHVHCHLTLCDRNRAFGGHLEEGCRVLSLAEIALMKLGRLKLQRVLDPGTAQTLLQVVPRYDGRARHQDGSLVSVERRLARRVAPKRRARASIETRRRGGIR